ncbi:hypothetical protein ACLQ2Q_00710 [Microbacterium sp. DT81.1]|uniref:hypothetical protein n=1 Tax=Microbacterium sp. DT81.1 TaxID=3393413 RepID=UPI003CF7BBFE
MIPEFHGDADGPPRSARITRRTMLLGTVAGAVGAVGGTSAASAADYSRVGRLPGEVSRAATKYTAAGNAYESIDVASGGDKARLFVPWTAPPSKPGTTVVWFYHSNGGDRTALTHVYGYPAALLVDRGIVSICPDYGGTLWTSQPAIDHQARWASWMSATFSVARAYSRSNSGGGPLMCWAYGQNMIPRLRGIYLVNSAYDMSDLYSRDPIRIAPVYGYSRTTMERTNPARLSSTSWTAKRIRVVVSMADAIVPPARHGTALINKAAPVATSTSARWHELGHKEPSWATTDMLTTFQSWA